MERERLKGRPVRLRMHINTILLFLTSVVILTVPVFAADSVTVSCYNEAVYLGDLGDIKDVTQAARLCNATYADCTGRCIGCSHDFESDKDICVDNQGRKVSK